MGDKFKVASRRRRQRNNNLNLPATQLILFPIMNGTFYYLYLGLSAGRLLSKLLHSEVGVCGQVEVTARGSEERDAQQAPAKRYW